MSKRAVIMSYALITDILTRDYVIERIECVKGVPASATLVEMIPLPGIDIAIVLVYDSDEWETEPDFRYPVISPKYGLLPVEEIDHRANLHQGCYSKALSVGGERFKITSKMPISVSADVKNHRDSYLASGPFAVLGEFTDIEELC